MKKNEWNEGLNQIDSDLVEKYVEQKDRLVQKKKFRSIWLRTGAIAACFTIVVSAILILPTLRKKVPTWDGPHYSAEEISKWFGSKNIEGAVATNAYTKIYVPDAKCLPICKMPSSEYLGIYQYNDKKIELNKDEFQAFIDEIFPNVADSIGATLPKYEIDEDDVISDSILRARVETGSYSISAAQNRISSRIGLYNHDRYDRKIIIEGETVQIDQRLSDEEIINSLQSIKSKLFRIFNVTFSDAKVVRYFDSYSKYGAQHIFIYFYNESAHPLNALRSVPLSDNICISFDNFANYGEDMVSDSILIDADIDYRKMRSDVTERFTLIANAKKISIEDAEALLYKGYVFGGHSCPLCMAQQDKVSFDGYDFVDIEYVFNDDDEADQPALGIPFYAFYKKIGTSENGNIIYAKTFVAAIEVSGYDEYFENQKDDHRSSNDY